MTRSIAAALGAAMTLTPAMAAETDVTIQTDLGTIAGTLETPDGDPAPIVLLLHGFTGSRDELPVAETDEGVFSRTARHLAEAGIASLRIDFRGSGDSSGEWADTTFSGQVTDALAAIAWMQQQESVDGSRLAVLGWSQGGLIAAHAAAASAEVDALILWAPVTAPAANFTNIFGAGPVFEAIDAEAETEIAMKLPWGDETVLKGAFFDEMLTMHTGAALAAYAGPVQVFMGLNDALIKPQPGAGAMLMGYHGGPEELHELDMDHVFNAFSGPATLDEQMIPKVLAWLNTHL